VPTGKWSNGTTISRSTFGGNKAATGGALYLDDQGSVITATGIHGNGATGDGGGIFDSPGGTPVPIIGSTITGNHAGGAGGGLDEESYGAVDPVTNTTIAGNSAADGGGINVGSGVLINFTGDTIAGNRASDDGGGINSRGGVLFTRAILFHRHADGIVKRTDSAQEYPSVSFTGSTISGNSAGRPRRRRFSTRDPSTRREPRSWVTEPSAGAAASTTTAPKHR